MQPDELKALRRKLRLTQVQLAAALQVTPNTVARWEQGVHPVSPLATVLLTHLGLTHGARRRGRKVS